MSLIDYSLMLESLSGEHIPLDTYKGRVLLVGNTASACGFTPQYEGLERLYRSYSDQGFSILGFPCNQFGNQEARDAESIGKFCKSKYDVTFPIFAKTDVNGRKTHPLFATLKAGARGLLGSQSIKWNFTKFLVDRDGQVLRRYAPTITPGAIKKDIEGLLGI